MTDAKDDLLSRIIHARIESIFNNRDTYHWMADVMNFGWTGYDKYSDAELITEAEELELEDIPTLEQLK